MDKRPDIKLIITKNTWNDTLWLIFNTFLVTFLKITAVKIPVIEFYPFIADVPIRFIPNLHYILLYKHKEKAWW